MLHELNDSVTNISSHDLNRAMHELHSGFTNSNWGNCIFPLSELIAGRSDVIDEECFVFVVQFIVLTLKQKKK